jgi:hypothetical protein
LSFFFTRRPYFRLAELRLRRSKNRNLGCNTKPSGPNLSMSERTSQAAPAPEEFAKAQRIMETHKKREKTLAQKERTIDF